MYNKLVHHGNKAAEYHDTAKTKFAQAKDAYDKAVKIFNDIKDSEAMKSFNHFLGTQKEGFEWDLKKKLDDLKRAKDATQNMITEGRKGVEMARKAYEESQRIYSQLSSMFSGSEGFQIQGVIDDLRPHAEQILKSYQDFGTKTYCGLHDQMCDELISPPFTAVEAGCTSIYNNVRNTVCDEVSSTVASTINRVPLLPKSVSTKAGSMSRDACYSAFPTSDALCPMVSSKLKPFALNFCKDSKPGMCSTQN
jgi:hypothetical protein